LNRGPIWCKEATAKWRATGMSDREKREKVRKKDASKKKELRRARSGESFRAHSGTESHLTERAGRK